MKRVRPLVDCLALLSLALFACDDDSAMPDSGFDYPLEVGSKWVYTARFDSVLSKQELRGEIFHQVAGSALLGVPMLIRMNEMNQLVFWNGESPQVLLDFGAPVGSQWMVGSYTVTVRNRNLPNVNVPAGEYSECYEFYLKSMATDSDIRIILATGVGVVIRVDGFSRMETLQEFTLGSQ